MLSRAELDSRSLSASIGLVPAEEVQSATSDRERRWRALRVPGAKAAFRRHVEVEARAQKQGQREPAISNDAPSHIHWPHPLQQDQQQW